MDQDNPSKRSAFRSQQTDLPGPSQGQFGRVRRWLGGLAIVCIVGAAVLIAVNYDRTPLPLPPNIDRADMHAAVAERLAQLRQEVLAKPRNGPAWGRLGMTLVAHEMMEEAAFCFTQACRFDGDEFRWQYLLGAVLEPIDKEAAIQAYERAIALDHSVPQPYLNIAELLLDLHRLDGAEQVLERSLAIEPENARAEFLLARLYLLRGDFSEALPHATRSFDRAPEQRATRELLAQLHFRCGDTVKAKQILNDLALLPSDAATWNDPYIEAALSYRVDPYAIVAAAQTQLLDGNSAPAIRSLELLVSQYPNQPTFHIRLVDALLDADQMDAAMITASRAKSECPANAEVAFASGVVFQRGERYSLAAMDFRRAIELKPEHVMAHFRLGECLRELGDIEKAITAFRDATRISPSFIAGEREAALLMERMPTPP